MKRISNLGSLGWLIIIVFGALITACFSDDRGRDPIFAVNDPIVAPPGDSDDEIPPRVTGVAPPNGATGVAINIVAVTASFNEEMAPVTDSSIFTVSCEDPCSDPDGEVSLNAAATVARFTLGEGTTLEPSTVYIGEVSGFTSLATGLEMLGPFVWQFTTGATPDTTRPRVLSTAPATSDPGPTEEAPVNTAISAVFTEDLDPSTVNASSFTVSCESPCASPEGVVSYSVASRTAVFKPDDALDFGETYTATLTTEITDLAGNELAGNQEPLPAASDYVWSFTTEVFVAPDHIEVMGVAPVDGQVEVCPDSSIHVMFYVPSGFRMDPDSVNSVTFSVTGPEPDETPVLASSVSLDVDMGTLASFTPLNDLSPGDTYTALVMGADDGVKDLAVPANTMENDFSWMFTVGPAEGQCLQTIDLNTVAPFGTFGGSAGMTNTGIQTIINGDIGSITTNNVDVTGLRDSNEPDPDVYTVTPDNDGLVNGLIFTCTTSTTGPTSDAVNPVSCEIATDARLDAEAAYLELAGLPAGPDPGFGNLANLTLAPGVYTANSASFMIQGGDLTLDAQGNGDAVWVFQMATTLTVGGPGVADPQSIILTNGAQSKNVFWQVGTAATINAAGGGTMEGTIISQDGVTFSTVGNVDIVTLNGRAISLGASVTMVNTVINVPAP